MNTNPAPSTIGPNEHRPEPRRAPEIRWPETVQAPVTAVRLVLHLIEKVGWWQ